MGSMTAAADTTLGPGRVLAVIGGIYMTQSVIGGMTFQGVPAAMRAEGARLDVIGSVYLFMLPWTVKFLWAPLVERYRLPIGGGRRSRHIVLLGQMLATVLLASMVFASPGTPPALMFAALALAALVTATVDIACDAYAIEQLRSRARGWGNAAQVGGGYLGAMIGGGLFLVLIDKAGWSTAVLVMTGILILLSLPMAATPEPPGEPARPGAARPSISDALARPAILWGLVTVLFYQSGIRMAQGMIAPFLIDAGFDLTLLGTVLGIGGTAAALAGTLVAGLAIRLVGAERVLRPMAAIQSALFACFLAAAFWPALPLEALIALLVAKSLIAGAAYVTIYSAMMNWSSPRQAGVDFTLFQCADAAMAALAGLGGGLLAQHLGYKACFASAVVAMALATALMPSLLKRTANHERKVP